jgi:spore germination protein YaaH
MKKGVFLFLFVLNLIPVFVSAQAKTEDKKLESLWYYMETERSRISLAKNIKKIHILAPQTYELGMNGEIKSNMKTDVLDYAMKNHVKVMPLLANTNGKIFNQKTIKDLLDHTENWPKVSKYMREEAYNKQYIGWQMDLENIPVEYKDKFTNFMQYLKSEFAQDNLILSAAIVSKASDNPKKMDSVFWKEWAGVYDYQALASTTDFLTIMAYDQPESKGPVATIQWSKGALDYALTKIPKEKISFGIPVYGWAYRSGEKNHFTMIDYAFTYSKLIDFNKTDPKNMTTGAGTSKSWGDISWVSYNQGGKNYTIWYEDKNSFASKLSQIKAKGVRGFSVWVLGDEDPKVWDNL